MALYIHIPFCKQKCAYCDFASYPGRGRDVARYLRALEEELARGLAEFGPRQLTSVFIGGGTPSLLTGEQLSRLMEAVRAHYPLAPGCEVTLEANPGAVDLARLRAFRACGVNRLSLGAQAAQDRLLQLLSRIHRWPQVEQAVSLARQAGFDNLNLDLMYALPGQSLADWRETLERALALRPEHLSLYSLIVEPGTPMSGWVARGELELPGEELELRQQHEAVGLLGAHGLARYEISNYARPGRACRHNLVYWRRGDYLGVGCAAHSMMGALRFGNSSDLDEYLSGAPRVDVERLSPEEQRREAVMLETRLTDGLSLEAYRARYRQDFASAYAPAIARLTQLGLARLTPERFALTERGLSVQNAVLALLLN